MSGGYGTQPYGTSPYGGLVVDPGPPAEPAAAPEGAGFPAITLRVCNPDGSYGAVLPAKVTCEVTLDDGSPNTLAFTYDAAHPTAALLADLVTVAVLVGGEEYDDMRFVLDDSGRDEVLDPDVDSWSALSILGQLAYGIVLPEGLQYEVPGAQLGAVTPGMALRQLIEKCQARGALSWVQLGFNDGFDSAGLPWSFLDGEFVEQGKTILDVVQNWHQRHVASARMEGTTLRLYGYGRQGTDRSQTAAGMLLRGRDLEDGPWNSNSRDARSVMYARGDLPNTDPDAGTEGAADAIPILVHEENSSALDRFGVREGWLSQQQVDSESKLRAIASGSLALTNRARDAYTYKLTFAGPLPLVTWTKGDVMQVRVRDRDRQMRARTITLAEDENEIITGAVAFGDRMMDADEELQRSLDRLTQMTGSSMDGGLYGPPMVTNDYIGDGEDPDRLVKVVQGDVPIAVFDKLVALGYTRVNYGGIFAVYVPKSVLDAVMDGEDVTSNNGSGTVRDAVPPGPVTNLTASSFPLISGTYLNTTTVRLTWTAPPDNDVAWYEISYQDLEFLRDQDDNWWNPMPDVTADSPGASKELLRPGVLYRFRVRAVDNWYNVSTWAYVEHRAARDQQPPNQQPSAPRVEPILFSALRIVWDGEPADGTDFTPAPVTTVQVHISTAANFTPSSSTRVGTITIVGGEDGELVVNDLDPGPTYYVRLLPVSPWGVPGESPGTASPAATGVTRDVFSEALPDGSVDPEKLAFNPADGNLIPDGSFERAEYRAALNAAGFLTSTGTSYSPGRVSGTGFTQPTPTTIPAAYPITQSMWTANTAAPGAFPTWPLNGTVGNVGGLARKTGTGMGAWYSSAFGVNGTDLIRVEMQVRCIQDASAGTVASQTVAIGLAGCNSGGTLLNQDGTTRGWYGGSLPASAPVKANGGTVTLVAWYRGISNIGSTAWGRAYDTPQPFPSGTVTGRVQAWIDYDPTIVAARMDATLEVVSCEVRVVNTTSVYDGSWTLDMAAGPSLFQRTDLLKGVPTKGDDVFYAVGRVKLLGTLTNQPVAQIIGRYYDSAGVFVTSRIVAKAGGFATNGWYQLEGRLSLGAEATEHRITGRIATVDIAVQGFNVGTGQTLRWDAVEVRKAMTNVLIDDLAVDNAKIRDLSVSKLTAGTINAQTIVGRSIETERQGGSLARVGMYGRGSGAARAYFGAVNSAGLTTVRIDGEDGSAEFGGTISAAEVNGWIRSRYGDAYIEFTNAVEDWNTGIGPGVQYVSTVPWVRTPSSMKLANGFVALTPSMFHIAGTSQSLGTASQFRHSVIVNRGNDTAQGDVESVVGRTEMAHPYGTFHFFDHMPTGSLTGNERGKIISLGMSGSDGGAAGWHMVRDGSALNANYLDAFRANGMFSPKAYCGIRASEFVISSFSAGKTDIQEFNLDGLDGERFSALDLIEDNPSQVWQRNDVELEEWFCGPMADRFPGWLTRGGGFGAHDLIGVLWRGAEELAERDRDLGMQLRSLLRRVERLEDVDGER